MWHFFSAWLIQRRSHFRSHRRSMFFSHPLRILSDSYIYLVGVFCIQFHQRLLFSSICSTLASFCCRLQPKAATNPIPADEHSRNLPEQGTKQCIFNSLSNTGGIKNIFLSNTREWICIRCCCRRHHFKLSWLNVARHANKYYRLFKIWLRVHIKGNNMQAIGLIWCGGLRSCS